jgi:hypothetical protein
MVNQRRYARCSCAVLTNISTEAKQGRVGVVTDLSPVGLRFDSIGKFAVDECVELVVHLPLTGPMTVSGRVVRVFETADNTSMYSHSTALEFFTPHFEFVELYPVRGQRVARSSVADS